MCAKIYNFIIILLTNNAPHDFGLTSQFLRCFQGLGLAKLFKGQMPFLKPKQQCQSIQGNY